MGADLLVDRQNPERAIQIIRGVTGGKLRYGIDIVGRETATLLQGTLQEASPEGKTHLLGLAGIPKEQDQKPGFDYHNVPIKLFHSSPPVGESLVTWLERLMATGYLRLPETVHADGGLAGINTALQMLREGSVSGKRIVVGL